MIAKGCLSWVLSPIIFFFLFIIIFYNSSFFFIVLIPFLLIIIFFFIFFRDPKRIIGKEIVSPADGKIRDLKLEKNQVFISIFMGITNVHVNRMPIDGVINEIKHFPGKHLRAYKKESENNEKVTIDIDSPIGKIKLVQIAGFIARRIYPYIKKGDKLKKGDKIGIIRFGSRVDVYLPVDKIENVTVKIKDKVYAGVTTIASIK
ncbi:MAG: phosphatidylserine decarboxylase [Thermoplasmatota archaeon]|jgi:phosphatidylserine decarboxylase